MRKRVPNGRSNVTRKTMHFAAVAAAVSAGMLAARGPASADIFQWEYIDPAGPSPGKQQSAMLCPDGAGAYARRGTYLANLNLTMAYLIDADLGAASYFSSLHPSN